LHHHLAVEESEVLSQVQGLFDDDDQTAMLHTIFSSLPPDPKLQPWVAQALTPAHLEARLRNLASSLGHDQLVAVLTQIHDGVDAATWREVEARTPDLAALVTTT
jgi:hypothetical protein